MFYVLLLLDVTVPYEYYEFEVVPDFVENELEYVVG